MKKLSISERLAIWYGSGDKLATVEKVTVFVITPPDKHHASVFINEDHVEDFINVRVDEQGNKLFKLAYPDSPF